MNSKFKTLKSKSLNMVLMAMATILLPVLDLARAKAQITVFEGSVSTLQVAQVSTNTYQWELYNDSTINFAAVPGTCPLSAARFTSGNTGAAVNVEWLQSGTYFFKVTAYDRSHCTNNIKIGIVKVIPHQVEAMISGIDQSGACQAVILDGSKSKGSIVKFEWSALDPGVNLSTHNNINTSLALSSNYTGILPASFRVSLKVTSLDGVSDADTTNIIINPAPVAGIYSSLNPQKDGSMIVDGSVSTGTGLSYKWTTTEGKIIGDSDKASAFLLGAGIYQLEVTDAFGCKSVRTFNFPIDLYKIIANPDHARTSWARDTTVFVLNNDEAIAPIITASVRIIVPPLHGSTRVNQDGSIVYIPKERAQGRDYFIYEVCDAVNLCDSALVTIDIADAGIQINEAFSPNGDGVNDQLIFKGLEIYPGTHLYIYTRSGQLVYKSENYMNDWDGSDMHNTSSGLVPTGVYYYILEPGGTGKTVKGFVYVGY